MSDSFAGIYSRLETDEKKNILLSVVSSAAEEITESDIFLSLSPESRSRITGEDRKAKTEECISVASDFGISLCADIKSGKDRNGRLIHLIVAENEQSFVNCFSVFLIDYLESIKPDKDLIYVAIELQRADAADDYKKNISAIDCLYDNITLRAFCASEK